MANKPGSRNSNYFNRLTNLVVRNNSARVLYLAVSQSLEAVSLKILPVQLGHDGLNKITENYLKIGKQRTVAKQTVLNYTLCSCEQGLYLNIINNRRSKSIFNLFNRFSTHQRFKEFYTDL